jgi:hypothetical protein
LITDMIGTERKAPEMPHIMYLRAAGSARLNLLLFVWYLIQKADKSHVLLIRVASATIPDGLPED